MLWHPTLEPVLKYENGKPIHAEPNSYKMPEEEVLNPQILNCFDIGGDRAERYMQKNNIDQPYKVERSEKDVPLTKILATTLDMKNELATMIHKVSSVDGTDLNNAMNKDEVGKELLDIVEKLNFEVQVIQMVPSPKLSKLNKKQRIDMLIEYRKLYFEKEPGAKNKAEVSARKAFHDMYPEFSLNKRLEDLYNNKIYCLCKEVFDRDRYSS